MQLLRLRVIQNVFIQGFLIALSLFLVYGAGLWFPFQFDDVANISKNFSIRSLDIGSQWMLHSRWFGEFLNRITFKFAAFDPFYYRLFNLVTHLSLGVAWFLLIRFLCRQTKKDEFINIYSELIALVSLGLFLLHPVQSQTVCYVIQARLEGFASLLVVMSLCFFVRGLIDSKPLSKFMFFTVSSAIIFVACGTKEIAFVAPFLAILCDLFWISNFSWAAFKKNIIYHLGFCVLTIGLTVYYLKYSFVKQIISLSAQSFNNRGNILTQSPLEMICAYKYLISSFQVILHYLYIFIWPLNLCVEYDFRLQHSFFSGAVLWPLSILCLVTSVFLAMIAIPKLRPISFGYFWFLIALAPRVSIVPSAELACDYKTYLASLGVLWMIAYGLCFLFRPVLGFNSLKEFSLRSMPLILIFFVLGGLTFQRIKVWRNGIVFWQDIVDKNPGRPRPLNNLGVALTEAGQYDLAIENFKKAIDLDMYYPDPLSNIAVVFSIKEMFPQAIMALERAIQIVPNYPEAYNNLAAMYLKCKDIDKAIPSLQEAIRLRSHYGKAHFNLGRCYLEKGEKELAWHSFKRAIEGDLDSEEGLSAYAQVSMMIEKYDEAARVFAILVKQGDNSFDTSFNFANALHMKGDLLQAEAIYKKLIANYPQDPRPRFNLAENLYAQEKFADAYEHFILFEEAFLSYPQAMFRAAHCLEKTVGLEKELELLERNKNKSFEPSVKEALKNELGRVRLQIKINAGQGSVTMQDLEKLFAI